MAHGDLIEGVVRTSEREVIEISIPGSVDLVVLARFTAATIGARADFDLDEIDDLRLAVDELSVSFGPLDAETRLPEHVVHVPLVPRLSGERVLPLRPVFRPGERRHDRVAGALQLVLLDERPQILEVVLAEGRVHHEVAGDAAAE